MKRAHLDTEPSLRRKGLYRFPYGGENKRAAIVEFLRDPNAQTQKKKEAAKDESWPQDSDVLHLNGMNRTYSSTGQ